MKSIQPRAKARSAAPKPRRIDTHHHYYPPKYLAESSKYHDGTVSHTPPWSAALSLSDMDKGGVETSILSISAPGVWFGDNAAARIEARECNEYGAQLARDHPGRFGLFASLPLPDVEGALREIDYSFGALKADGVVMMTNVNDQWLGDAAFAPVFNELNRRKAIVYVHPTVATCCRNLVPDVPGSMIEFGTDTTRTIASLLFSGTSARCPNIRFLFSHAGGTMPYITERFTRLAARKDLAAKLPKGVMHHHAVVRNVTDRGYRMGIGVSDTILMYLPLFHMFGFTEGLLMSFLTGARQVLTATFDARECLGLIESERVTLLHGFDLHFKDLLDAQVEAKRDLSSVRTGILASGMSNSWAIARQARKTFGPLLSGFGMTEFCVGAALSALDSSEEQCVEASGSAAPGYGIRIIDPATGMDQPTGTPGEILISGYTMMQGYFNKPAETAAALDRDGWLHTGDMGVLREDGHLRFMGRYKDMLKIGGENVDPMEVEAFLMGHPAVDLAVVVSYPDARLSEVGVAYVRLKPGQSASEDDIIAYCRGRIASYKVPRRAIFTDDFPMTSSGKIQKSKLRDDVLKRYPAEAGDA